MEWIIKLREELEIGERSAVACTADWGALSNSERKWRYGYGQLRPVQRIEVPTYGADNLLGNNRNGVHG